MHNHCLICCRELGALFSKTEAATRQKKRGIIKSLLAGAAAGAAAGYGIHKLQQRRERKQREQSRAREDRIKAYENRRNKDIF